MNCECTNDTDMYKIEHVLCVDSPRNMCAYIVCRYIHMYMSMSMYVYIYI